MIDCSRVAEYRVMLAQAELALHNLMTGQSPRVIVDQNGERVEYTAINASRLQLYIQTLRSDIAVCDLGTETSTGPVGFLF